MRTRLDCSLFVVCTLLAAIVLGGAQATIIRLAFIGPNQPVPLQVAIRENEEALVDVPEVGEFTVTARTDSDSMVLVTLIGKSRSTSGIHKTVRLPKTGETVTSGTSPEFKLRLLAVRRAQGN